MQIVKTAVELTHLLESFKHQKIGFVPTMGALHKGHISLIDASKSHSNITVCSIFINPTQFNQQADFDKYPITLAEDIQQLEQADCDILFLPSLAEVYPNGTTPIKPYPLGNLANILEGAFRPGHFQGVCQVVDRLLALVAPHFIFMGQKDYQQCKVVERLLKMPHLNHQAKLISLPTFREKSMLAMSSRNRRLSADDLEKAGELYQSLLYVTNTLKPGNEKACLQKATHNLLQNGFDSVDYIALANADSLILIEQWDGLEPLVVLGAAFLNGVRLIDNLILPVHLKGLH
ncbi:MAG: pantoate--beta-alanine ligase [Sphingobacteriia bacterium]|nr:MAG: pantoate--beta-alanine ligase [Sphingobacteriia bacterium]